LGGEPIRRPVYALGEGLKVLKRGNRLLFEVNGERTFVPLGVIDYLVVFPGVELTSSAVRFLCAEGRCVFFVNSFGRVVSVAFSEILGSSTAGLRQLQYRYFLKESFCLRLTKRLLALKVDTLARTLGLSEREREELLSALKGVKGFEQLLAFDGRLGRLTFSSLARLIKPPFEFKKREYYPPPDPVNAVLSFSYTFFYSQLYALILSRGLDPYCGFFHKRRGVHATLSSDLIEPIRPKVTAFVFSLFNGGFFKEEDFKKKGGGVVMEKEKLRELVKALVTLDREQFLIKDPVEFLDELIKRLR